MGPAAARDSDKLSRCQRTGQDIPLSAPRCLDPKAYCKGRTACPIHLLEKEAARGGG